MRHLEKYFEDKRFIKWVFSSDKEQDLWRENYKYYNSIEQENIQLAHKILKMLHTKDKDLSEEERLYLYSNIIEQISQRQQKRKLYRKFKNSLKYAAVAIVFFILGAILFYQK